ncbi:MAG: hypothetical protein ACFKPT_20380 [Gloeotrichia echinulata GP01]
MTNYCKPGERVRLLYAFSGDSVGKTIFFQDSISVTVTQGLDGFDNINPGGFRIFWDDPNPNVSQVRAGSEIVLAFYTRRATEQWKYWADTIVFLKCDGTTALGTIAFNQQPYIDNSRRCVGSIPSAIYTLTVKSLGGVQLFSVSGKSSVNYSVVCGDECPPGFCKCPTTNYPGYCCLPCAQVAAELAAIVSIARSKR